MRADMLGNAGEQGVTADDTLDTPWGEPTVVSRGIGLSPSAIADKECW